jgi:hypothetical protein
MKRVRKIVSNGVGAVYDGVIKLGVDGLSFLAGWILLTIGVACYDPRAGAIAAGAILLLSLKPLWKWIK